MTSVSSYVNLSIDSQCKLFDWFQHDIDHRHESSIQKWGDQANKPSNKQPKFLHLLVLVHLKNYFIEVLNKFLMCFEINGLKKF